MQMSKMFLKYGVYRELVIKEFLDEKFGNPK